MKPAAPVTAITLSVPPGERAPPPSASSRTMGTGVETPSSHEFSAAGDRQDAAGDSDFLFRFDFGRTNFTAETVNLPREELVLFEFAVEEGGGHPHLLLETERGQDVQISSLIAAVPKVVDLEQSL